MKGLPPTDFNAPHGVRWSDSEFYDDEEMCCCGHTESDHGDVALGPCEVMDCTCNQYEPWLEAA